MPPGIGDPEHDFVGYPRATRRLEGYIYPEDLKGPKTLFAVPLLTCKTSTPGRWVSATHSCPGGVRPYRVEGLLVHDLH